LLTLTGMGRKKIDIAFAMGVPTSVVCRLLDFNHGGFVLQMLTKLRYIGRAKGSAKTGPAPGSLHCQASSRCFSVTGVSFLFLPVYGEPRRVSTNGEPFRRWSCFAEHLACKLSLFWDRRGGPPVRWLSTLPDSL
jgi:hypothetical protein